ncbi:uncharacterized protein BKCO1_7100043 [Diplodia corticola]|uniref:Uncharacterized protein n=1 Tax=Diplodia corticola TaxID=236234 RepID=A0A1J9RBK2_9PEZI|nr:uncharacterized protein BKCO1_7100043 [Diplodia corticola]OJD29827.1 hypothetical protein BKCO1_7100043 [Diplodia corticola]
MALLSSSTTPSAFSAHLIISDTASGNSARARSQAAGASIQSLPRTGGYSSSQNAPPRRIITPVRNGDSSPAGRFQTPRTQPRVQTRVGGGPGGGPYRSYPRAGSAPGGGPRTPGRFGNKGPPGRGGPRQGGAGGKRRSRNGPKKDDDGSGKNVQLSKPMLQYLLQLKAKRRAVKSYTPHDTTKAELTSQSALSASLGQPGGAPALLDARLRSLADRALLDDPVPILAQARRLVRGQFVKFASDTEREAVMALVADEQARIARKLSDKKGEEIAPKAIEFAELDPAARKATTDALVAGAYTVRARAVEPPATAHTRTANNDKPIDANYNVATRMLDLNASYVGGDADRFLGRLHAIMNVQGGPTGKRQEKAQKA